MRIRLFSFVFILLTVLACETSIDLFSEKVNQAIVYGVICPNDSLYYIRIQKTFQTANSNEFTINNSDLYFDSVNVRMLGISRDEVIWTKPLTRKLVKKDSGRFPYDNHYLYFCESPLMNNTSDGSIETPEIELFRLDVELPEYGIRTMAETRALGPTRIYLDRYGSKSISCYGDNISKVHFSYDSKGNSSSSSGSYVEFGMKYYYSEYGYEYVNHDSIISVSKDAPFSDGGYLLYPERIFNRIMIGIDKDVEVSTRVLDSIHFFSQISDGAFANYWDTRINREDHDFPPFSNFDHNDVFGMFFSVTKGYETGFFLDQRSMDSLCNGQKWKHLKFRSW